MAASVDVGCSLVVQFRIETTHQNLRARECQATQIQKGKRAKTEHGNNKAKQSKAKENNRLIPPGRKEVTAFLSSKCVSVNNYIRPMGS
jgi:hypothetical protein